MRCVLWIPAMLIGCLSVHGQELSATRLELRGTPWNGVTGAILGTRDVIPLVLGTTATVPQPIRFQVGSLGSIRAAELTGVGETWLRGPVAIGASTGTIPTTQLRIGTVSSSGGLGLDVDLRWTTDASGIWVRGIGASGTDHAGILVSSAQNGQGTGIRLGGPSGSGRPTLLTGIEITGGTGLRYNALVSGSGTAITIGGTIPPQRGLEVSVGGSDHVGIYTQGNTSGTALIAAVVSSAYPPPSPRPQTAAMAIAATNASVSSDTLIGMLGVAQRGGSGSKLMMSIGVKASAQHNATSHGGIAIGLQADASSSAPSSATAVSALCLSQPGGTALAVNEGLVYLGSSAEDRPQSLFFLPGSGRTMTSVYTLRSSGSRYCVGTMAMTLGAGPVGALAVGDGEMLLLTGSFIQSVVEGLAGGSPGRLMTLIAIGYPVELRHNSFAVNAEQRFLLPAQQDLIIPIDGAATVWYDGIVQRWRLVGRSW